jgi:hypothetical protein
LRCGKRALTIVVARRARLPHNRPKGGYGRAAAPQFAGETADDLIVDLPACGKLHAEDLSLPALTLVPCCTMS